MSQPPSHPDRSASPTSTSPNSQTPGHPSFRRQRASRACETCHARKVRCDAASLGVPCTNCVAFSIECKIPVPKRKRAQEKAKDPDHGEYDDNVKERSEDAEPTRQPLTSTAAQSENRTATHSVAVYNSQAGTPVTSLTEEQAARQAHDNRTYVHFMKPKFARAPIKEAGRVAYLGESSNLSLLVRDNQGATDVVHYPLPDTSRGSRARLTELDNVEIDILRQRGAFLLPPRTLCDELVDAFFQWVAPVAPVINRSRFMKRYRDPENPPSLLLLQAVLLAGSRVCTNPQLMDANGSTTPAAMTFYKRAKALYDANYEDDRVTIVQALVLMGWYWEGPEDVTKNVFYWSRVATIVAQGSGMHRSVEGSQLSRADKRLWKRIWWTLFTRDRSVAVALGRPVHINVDDSDVEMLTEDDFVEDEEPGKPAEYPPDSLHVQFFLQYVKLCEIMGLVLSQQYSVASKARRHNAIDLTHSDMALADWLQNCPKEVYWEPQRHHYWAALLHSNYYTTLCLLHRAHMPPATAQMSVSSNGYDEEDPYPSRNIAFQAAAMITSIIENLQAHNELRYCPAFIVYTLFSALIMHVYQMRSSVPGVVQASQDRLRICMDGLKEVSKVWLVAKMVYTLFESILGNKVLEERLQKAAGKRHFKVKQQKPPQMSTGRTDSSKRKFDEMELGFTNAAPAPPVSYERSRPQTPAPTPSRDPGAQQNMGLEHGRPQDAFLGAGSSRTNTRPPTPFNPSLSYPGSPPDFFLVTRNSPSISQSIWENFQPDQLFPDGANMGIPPLATPGSVVDPQLAQNPLSAMQTPIQQPIPMATQHNENLLRSPLQSIHSVPVQGLPQQNLGWQGQFDPLNGELGATPDQDSWSNSSKGPIAPTTLNVEDWFQFFGMNSDMNGLNVDMV